MKIAIERIAADSQCQSRSRMDQETIDEYAREITDGTVLPPVVVFGDINSGPLFLADGFHRYQAHIRAAESEIDCVVTPGGLDEAIDFATRANTSHGLRRTNADKRRAVTMAIELDTKLDRNRSDNAIAAHCGVSGPFVGDVRKSLQTVGSEVPTTRTFTTKDGTPRQMNVSNIGPGKSTPPPPDDPKPEPTPAISAPPEDPEPLPPSSPAVAPPPPDDDYLDPAGRKVTDPVVMESMARLEMFKEVVRKLGVVKREVSSLGDLPVGVELRKQQIVTDIENASAAVRAGMPYTTCPMAPNCTSSCTYCRGKRWVTKEVWTRLPAEIKGS